MLDWEKGRGLHYPNWLAKTIFKLSNNSFVIKDLEKSVISIIIPCLNEKRTIYNVLNDFHEKGLISKVMIDDDRAWFDTNTSDHFHVYDTNNNKLFDIEPKDINLSLPKKIKDSEIKNIEILIKI